MKQLKISILLVLIISGCATSESLIRPDNNPPVILSASGSGIYPFGTKEVILELKTEKPAECRLGNSSGHPFGALYTRFETIDGLTHTLPVATYDPGTSVLFAQCKDLRNQIVTPDEIPFTIDITTKQTARIKKK